MPSYCIFADFLGYRHTIKEAVERDEEYLVFQDFIDNVEPVIARIFNSDESIPIKDYKKSWDAKTFTDNVVLGCTFWSQDGEKEFGIAIAQIVEFQHAMALRGFFVRGGWAIGRLFMSKNTIFGGSLLEAYDLESKVAEYPRVVLSDVMKDIVYRHMVRHGDKPPQCTHLLTDSENTFFTNYLIETTDYGEVSWGDLHRHAELIAIRLEEHKLNDSVLPKYQWLAAYHNFFCGLLCDESGFSDDLIIGGTFPDYGIREIRQEESPYLEAVLAEAKRRQEKLARLLSHDGDHAGGGDEAD